VRDQGAKTGGHGDLTLETGREHVGRVMADAFHTRKVLLHAHAGNCY